jgi:hypothetical protein
MLSDLIRSMTPGLIVWLALMGIVVASVLLLFAIGPEEGEE